ncbi:hypothetical protein HNP00_003238 [Arthrobacter sp. AZCC_0090]|nr:hypothetical protein [Arthrobacter sp. AZCC_0090]
MQKGSIVAGNLIRRDVQNVAPQAPASNANTATMGSVHRNG